MSANCNLDETKGVQMRPSSIFSLMKRLFTSTCLVRSCWIRLCAMLMAALLSQYSLMGSSTSTCNSFSKVLIHMSLQIPRAIAWYLALTFDLATTSFFTPPSHQVASYNGAIPLSRSPANYRSNIISINVSLSTCMWLFLENNNPMLGVAFRYLNILIIASKWSSKGACMNWLTTPTTYAMSSLVWDRYINLPASL